MAARAYAIDFVSDASGKHIKSSKYRILFRFGFSPNHHPVLEHEHVVTLSWSPVSGKAILAADGQEVHMSNHFQTGSKRGIRGGGVGGGGGSRGKLIGSPKVPHRKQARFEHSWDLVSTDMEEQSHSLEIVACSYHQHHRQFDLMIDGVSYFDLPKYDDEEGRIMGSNNVEATTAACAGAAEKDDDAEDSNTAASSPGSRSHSAAEADCSTTATGEEDRAGDGSWLDIDAAVESLAVGDMANVDEFSIAEQLQQPTADLSQ